MNKQQKTSETQSQQHVHDVISNLGAELAAIMKDEETSKDSVKDIPLPKKKKKKEQNKQGIETGHNEIKVNAAPTEKKEDPLEPAYTKEDAKREKAAVPVQPERKKSQQPEKKEELKSEAASRAMEDTLQSEEDIQLSAALESLKRTTMATRDTLSDERFTDVGSGDLNKKKRKIGRQVDAEEAKRLADGPRATLIIHTRTIEKDGEKTKETPSISVKENRNDETGVKPAYLVLVETGEVIDVNPHSFRIGKDESCDCVIDEHYVSRKHAAISVIDGEYYIEDLGSTNGTFVNRIRVEGSTKTRLYAGDMIKLADIKLRFLEK